MAATTAPEAAAASSRRRFSASTGALPSPRLWSVAMVASPVPKPLSGLTIRKRS